MPKFTELAQTPSCFFGPYGRATTKMLPSIEKFRLIVFALYIKAITRISPEFSELSLWPDTQSFDIWSIPPRLEVLPLTQNYQTEQKDFGSKYFQNRNLQTIPFKMMYNMSILRHRFSNERWGGGGGRPEPPSSLIL